MKGKIALLDNFEGKEAAALLIDGKLHDFFTEPGMKAPGAIFRVKVKHCLLYTSPSPRDATLSRMPSSA